MAEHTRPLGAYSRQRAALAGLAVPVLIRLGMRPAVDLVKRAEWGLDRGVVPHRDYRLKGIRRG